MAYSPLHSYDSIADSVSEAVTTVLDSPGLCTLAAFGLVAIFALIVFKRMVE